MVHHNENIVTAESASDEAKIGYTEKEDTHPKVAGAELYNEDDPNHHLHRGLKSRQISMIAIGGAIGTGLIIGTYVEHPPSDFPRRCHCRYPVPATQVRCPLAIRVHQAHDVVAVVTCGRQLRRTPLAKRPRADQRYVTGDKRS